jgi:hypothetical protein
LYDDTDLATELEGKLDDTVSDSEKENIIERQFHTPQMLVSRPGRINSAFSDPSMRHSSGKLFGMVADDFRGHRMIADSSLSAHSSKLVQKALEAGVLEENPINPSGETTNHIRFSRRLREDHAPNQRPIEDVNRATRDLMDRLGRRGASLSSQFSTQGEWGPRVPDSKQLKLF